MGCVGKAREFSEGGKFEWPNRPILIRRTKWRFSVFVKTITVESFVNSAPEVILRAHVRVTADVSGQGLRGAPSPHWMPGQAPTRSLGRID